MQNLHYNSTSKPAFLAVLLLSLLFYGRPVQAQEVESYDSLFNEYASLDSLLLAEFESDSNAIYDLLADLLNEDYLKSQLTLRTGYTSNITNAGRNFGVQQYGLNAGLAFYHKTGFFADLSGYYNSDQEPKYNTTVTAFGYMGMLGPHWNYLLSFDHFFYHQAASEDVIVEYPLSNSLNSSINYLFKGFNIGTDYSFMFGDETAHRIRFNFGYSYATKKVWIFDAISINPNISALAGNAIVTSTVFNKEIAIENSQELIRQIGRRRYLLLYQSNPELLKAMLSEIESKNTFGMMNYSLFIPVSFRINHFSLMVNYSLNLPVALPGEEGLDTSPNNYISASLLFSIPFK